MLPQPPYFPKAQLISLVDNVLTLVTETAIFSFFSEKITYFFFGENFRKFTKNSARRRVCLGVVNIYLAKYYNIRSGRLAQSVAHSTQKSYFCDPKVVSSKLPGVEYFFFLFFYCKFWLSNIFFFVLFFDCFVYYRIKG